MWGHACLCWVGHPTCLRKSLTDGASPAAEQLLSGYLPGFKKQRDPPKCAFSACLLLVRGHVVVHKLAHNPQALSVETSFARWGQATTASYSTLCTLWTLWKMIVSLRSLPGTWATGLDDSGQRRRSSSVYPLVSRLSWCGGGAGRPVRIADIL